jgi:hypothetical protein
MTPWCFPGLPGLEMVYSVNEFQSRPGFHALAPKRAGADPAATRYARLTIDAR